MKKSYDASETTGATGRTGSSQSAAAREAPGDLTGRDEAGHTEKRGAGGVFVALLNDALHGATDYVVNYSAGRGAE